MSIEIQSISKTFGTVGVLKDVSLKVPSGELVALLGPSGSGKTTLLRVIAGLERPSAGRVLFDGHDITPVHVRDRRVGFVFQHYALFKHMSVFKNVAFGLSVRPRATRPSKSEIADRVMRLLKLVQLDKFAHRFPSQLSGGQRQRVALARALAVEPKVLLLDEPFGALDAKVRVELRRWLRRFHDEIHVTSVFVTHDQEEAMDVADRVVVMSNGQIEQVGAAEEVYHRPANPFVCDFLGIVNSFHARVVDGRPSLGTGVNGFAGRTQERALRAASQDLAGLNGHDSALVYVRPHMLDLDTRPVGELHLPALVRHVNAAGALVKVELVSDEGTDVQVELSHERYRALALKPGDRVFVIPRDMRVFVEG